MPYAAFRGTCPVCGGDYALTQQNKVRRHPAPTPEEADKDGKCLGSNKPPTK